MNDVTIPSRIASFSWGALWFAIPAIARADIAPVAPPTRPEWDQTPLPMPTDPTVLVTLLVAAAMIAMVIVVFWRRRVPPRGPEPRITPVPVPWPWPPIAAAIQPSATTRADGSPSRISEPDVDGMIAKLESRSGPGHSPWPLAAALHHRGCVRAALGDTCAALADVTRATELDGYPVYWTTRALLEERLSHRDSAVRSHDTAVELLSGRPSAVPFFSPPIVIRPELASRTWLARGVFRARNDDRAGALADVRAAIARAPSPLSERWQKALESG